MRNLLLCFALIALVYGCTEISGKDLPKASKTDRQPPEQLRVGRAEAMVMRGRRGKDDASVKISAQDLLSLIQGNPAAGDSFIFYFVKYDGGSGKERGRYAQKVPDANWTEIAKKPSGLLVGFIGGGGARQGMRLSPLPQRTTVSVYDLGVLCPPPPDCACDIAQ